MNEKNIFKGLLFDFPLDVTHSWVKFSVALIVSGIC